MSILDIPPELQKQLYTDNWPIRRRWLRIGMIAFWINAEWILWSILSVVEPSPMKVEIFMIVIGAIMTIFMGFVFGATWDDNNKRYHVAQMLKDAPADDPTVVK